MVEKTAAQLCVFWYGAKSVDFLLTAKSDKKAALRFFKKAISQHGRSNTVTIYKSGVNTAVLSDFNEDVTDKITIR